MAGLVCVDASLVLQVLLPDARTPEVDGLWDAWSAQETDLVSPPLFFAEVTSVLRLQVHLRRIEAEFGERAFSLFMRMRVRVVSPPDLQPRAWALAKEHGLPRAYDAQYLAVADSLACELWTADGRLARAVRVPWLRLVGAEPPAA